MICCVHMSQADHKWPGNLVFSGYAFLSDLPDLAVQEVDFYSLLMYVLSTHNLASSGSIK